MAPEIKRIISDYKLDFLSQDVEGTATVNNLYIGILGEFSSGKSSLLNSILGKKILPAMDKATTKSLSYVQSDINQEEEVEYFQITENSELEKISLLDYQDIAKGLSAGEALVSLKDNNFLNNGYIFIDTPGVSSLDQTDADITYGLLPKLDGIVICIDSNTGSLNSSLKAFLENPEINSIKEKIIFVLTKSDQKSDESMKKIISGFKNDLQQYINVDDLENRILPFSSTNIIEKGDSQELEKLLNLFEITIHSKKRQMIERRQKKQEQKLAVKLIDSLEDLKKNLSYNDEKFQEEQAKSNHDEEKLHNEKKSIKKKFESFEDYIREEIKAVNNKYLTQISFECMKVTPDDEQLNLIFQEYNNKVVALFENSIQKFFQSENIIPDKTLDIDLSSISQTISQTLKAKEIITGITTSIIAAALSGGTSVAANAAEGTASMIAQTAGKKVATEVAKKTIFNKLAPIVLAGMKQSNPIEHLGSYIARKKIENTLQIDFENLGRKICMQALNFIELEIEASFEKIGEKLKIIENNIDLARKTMKSGKKEIEDLKIKIIRDIIYLKGIANKD